MHFSKVTHSLRQNSGKSQGICCLKYIFSQVEDSNFKNFLGEHAPDPLNGLGITVELNLIYLLTGYPVRTEKYQARSHIVRTERSEVRAT